MCKLWVVDISNQFALGLHVVNFWNWKPTLTTGCMRVRTSKRETGDWTMFPLVELVGGCHGGCPPPPLWKYVMKLGKNRWKGKKKKREKQTTYICFFFFFMFIYPYNVDKHEIFLKFSLQLPYENFLDPRMVSLFITIPFLNIKKKTSIYASSR